MIQKNMVIKNAIDSNQVAACTVCERGVGFQCTICPCDPVVIVSVEATGVAPFVVTTVGENEHPAPDGKFEQARTTELVNVFIPATDRLYVADWPGATVAEFGAAAT